MSQAVTLSDDLVAGASGASRFTGLSQRAIYHLVAKGLLPVCRVGRRMYFRKSALLDFFSPEQRAA